MESSTQPCTELPPTPTGDQSQQSSSVWGFFPLLSPGGRKPGTPFPTASFTEGRKASWCRRQMQKQHLALPSQRKEKPDFCFPAPDFLSLSSAAATDTVLMQGFTFIIWKAAREVKNMQMWPIKKRQEVLLQHSWWPSSTAEPHHHGN